MAPTPDAPSPELGVVVIPGAFRGAWSVAPVVDGLRGSGCRAAPALLTGMDPAATASERASATAVALAQWVDDVVAAARRLQVNQVVLIGHSQGGMVAAAAAETAPDLVAGIGFLDAPIPLPGQRGVDLGGTAPDSLADAATWLEPHPVAASEWMDVELADRVNRHLSPTPLGPSLTPIISRPVEVPWVAAFCEGTPAMYPSAVTRARLEDADEKFAVFDAGHEIPLSDPGIVVEWCLGSWQLGHPDTGS